ncbi:hypothetical protein CC86DRAFT_410897 [Ophiobolus disseminans]|uniref:Uncharacterized protein n=1 Tax=Ophiobolus disseminans TaxID=1469910 RepID=A0A6A6ZLR5_9PLEO|nr:hypothetical protein CC86DRAFT_410897 [Ophiobolus disseminans]
MDEPTPTMDIKAIFRDLRNPQSRASHPTEAIKSHGQKLARDVHTKYKQFRCMRENILTKAWPGNPLLHRPEAFGDTAKPLEKLLRKLPLNCFMLPFLNVDDLARDEMTLLMLLDTRSRHPPHTFARTELIFSPLGAVDQGKSRASLLKMQLDDPNNYGTIIGFTSEDDAINFECKGKGLTPVAGLQVLYMQDKLLGFLFGVIRLILPDNLQGADADLDPPEPVFSSDLYDESSLAMFDVAVKEPYRSRQGLQLHRLEQLVSAEAQDRVWDVREDPRFWEALYNTTLDHDKAQILDVKGRTDRIIGTPEFTSLVLQDAVARSHYMLVLWDQLHTLLKRIKALFEANPQGIIVNTLKPTDLDAKKLLERVSDPTAAWDKIFQQAAATGFITSLDLSKPGTQFFYNVKAKKSRKRTVDMLCKVEANLDRFWNHVDSNLNAFVDNYQQGVLQRLLDEGGDMHRTIPWSERDHTRDEKQVPFKEAFDFKYQPLSTTFHDNSKEITGSFDRSSIVEKGKEKTRGTDATEEQAEPAREPSPESPLEFAVDKHSFEAFRALFHMPGKEQAASIRWNDVVSALTSIGFSAQHLHGSQWQFNPAAAPVAELNLRRGIGFHAPHPADEVPLDLARRHGRRLSRAYGWEGSMFKGI